MHAARLGEERAALERLDDQVVGDVAREAEVDRGVDERLHDQEDVGRAGAADGGGHRHELLVVDLQLAPRLPSRTLACSRCASVTSGVAYQTVMPRPSWAGVLGMLRTIWRWPRTLASAVVVAPAMMLMTSWPSRMHGPKLAADAREHLRLDREHDDVGALDGR